MRGGRGLRIVGWVVAGLAVVIATLWGVGAIYYSDLPGARLRPSLAIVWPVVVALGFLLIRPRWRALVAFAVVFALLVIWWERIPASSNRNWQPDVAVTPWATIDGNTIVVHGVRNLDYRTETDFVPRWEDRTYDLRQLDTLDLIAVYWAGKPIAHIMMSFGFAGKDYLTISIETRKEKGESYSTIAGFFKQYELIYIVADERDVIRVRTNYRNPQEDVYVYRVKGPRENLHRFFLDYLREMNELHEHPQFYNTLTTNCTTGVVLHTRVNGGGPPRSWKILLSGYFPDYAYELGRLDRSRPFAELERMSKVNERAHAADKDPAFSQRIREGLPMPASSGG